MFYEFEFLYFGVAWGEKSRNLKDTKIMRWHCFWKRKKNPGKKSKIMRRLCDIMRRLCDIMRRVCDIFWVYGRLGKIYTHTKKLPWIDHRSTELNPQQQQQCCNIVHRNIRLVTLFTVMLIIESSEFQQALGKTWHSRSYWGRRKKQSEKQTSHPISPINIICEN